MSLLSNPIFAAIGALVVFLAGFWLRGYMLKKNPELLRKWIDQANALGDRLEEKISNKG